jgi:hypothetical protein
MDEVCGKYGTESKCMEDFYGEIYTKDTNLKS